MLNRVPKNLSPELIKTLMEMGHGDEILLADANYPAVSNNKKIIRADGLMIPELLDSILKLMPLDSYSDYQAFFMQVVPGDQNVPNSTPPIWEKYRDSIGKSFKNYTVKQIERSAFYEYSHQCFAIVQTGEKALYGNLILRKGVVM